MARETAPGSSGSIRKRFSCDAEGCSGLANDPARFCVHVSASGAGVFGQSECWSVGSQRSFFARTNRGSAGVVQAFGEYLRRRGGGKVFRSRWMRANELGPCRVTGSGSTAIDKSVSAVMSSVWLVFVQCFRRSSGVQVDSRRGPRPGFGSKWVLPIDVSW